MTSPAPHTPDQHTTAVHDRPADARAGDPRRPRRFRWSVAGMAVAGLMVAGGVGGVVADSTTTDTPLSAAAAPAASSPAASSPAASSPAASSSSSGTGLPTGEEAAGGAFSAQTVADPATLAETLDHVHGGIEVPEAGGSSSDLRRAPGAEGTPVDAGVEVQDAPGVLLVDTETTYGEGAGTGMVITEDGLALTNYHVVDGSSEVEVTAAGTGESYTATVVGRDATQDVAVLQLQDASGLDTISVDSSGVEAGEDVAAVGNGAGQGYLTAVSGAVTGVDQSIAAESLGDTEDLSGLIATEADVVPGYSGGPLVDRDGQVVGMSTAASTGETSEEVNGFAVQITEALGIADQIVAGTESDGVQVGASGALGITIADPRVAEGALVVEVSPGSAAETAGLASSDIVTALDGTAVTDSAELSDRVSSLDPGDTVTLDWTDPEGAEHTETVDLGESTVN